MAGEIKPMSQIKQLLQLHQKGESKKQIARCLGMSKNTVKTYLLKLLVLLLKTIKLIYQRVIHEFFFIELTVFYKAFFNLLKK
jgi:hypothetical protein